MSKSEAATGEIGRRNDKTFRWIVLDHPAALLIGLAAVAGVAMRVALYRSGSGATNSDEAVLGLMVRHALHGEFTTFLWGTAYGGTQEVWLTVPLFWIAGSSLLALRAVPFALDVVTALLVWRLGTRTIGPRAAYVAGALYWIWPPAAIFLHGRQAGFYASNDLYCVLILLLVLRAAERPNTPRIALLGLILGLAFWQTSQIVPLEIAAVAWLGWRRPSVLRRVWAAAPLALLGALPWIVWNLAHHWGSLHLAAGSNSTYLWRLRTFASPVLPEALALRRPSFEWLVPYGVAAGAYLVLIGLFIVGALRTRRRDVSLLYAVAASFPFIVALSPKTFTGDTRYLSVVMPVFALLLAQLGTTYVRAATLLALALAISVSHLHDTVVEFDRTLGTGTVPPRSIAPLISTLDELHVHRVYADYWIAYRIAFDSNERIIAVENKFDRLVAHDGDVVPAHDPFVRYQPYEDEVRRGPHVFVFFRSTLPSPAVLARLERSGYKRRLVQTFVLYARPARPS